MDATTPHNRCINSYEEISKTAKYILGKTKHSPRIGIICGSGLGGLADTIEDQECLLYEDIPNFPVSTVHGHTGKMVIGVLNGVPVVCLQGRFHFYEGYELWQCTIPIRVMKLMGVGQLIVTNAAGGVNPDYYEGDIMLIKDHINLPGLAGISPLRGMNDDRFGVRFPATSNCYHKMYRQKAKELAKKVGIADILREGVYAMCGGPTYESVAEIKMMRNMGIDAVGMSTVPEVIIAGHCGITVFALTLITDMAIDEYEKEEETNHGEVLAVASKRTEVIQRLITDMVKEMRV